MAAKHEEIETLEAVSPTPSDDKHQTKPSEDIRPWHKLWFRLGPISGLCSILVAAAALVASLGILAGSNGQPVEGWHVPPSTYLAIFTAIANLCVRYAATQGVIILWWRRATAGTTLADLHSSWRIGNMIRGAVAAGPRMGLLGLACIVSTLVVIDGPLLQRASTVITIDNPGHVSLQISMAPKLPHGFSGFWATPAGLGTPGARSTVVFNSTVPTGDGGQASNYILAGTIGTTDVYSKSWWADNPLVGAVRGCPGTCTATIQGPALFATSCQTHELPVDVLMRYNDTAVFEADIGPPLEVQGFLIAPSLIFEQGFEKINLVTGYSTFDENCTGRLSYTACTYASSIGQYDVEIEADEITMTTLKSPTLIALANNTAVNSTYSEVYNGHDSTLGGIVNLMLLKWQSYVAYYSANASSTAHLINLEQGAFGPAQFISTTASLRCPSYTDPQSQAVNSMNKLMLYLGAGAASGDYPGLQQIDERDLKSTVVGKLQGLISIYSTNYWYFFGAALVDVVCLVVLLPTYWAWWRIGRPVSFSPLEMAKAFKSPLLADLHSNSSGRELAAKAGTARVRYGVLTTTNGTELGFGETDAVRSPPKDGISVDV